MSKEISSPPHSDLHEQAVLGHIISNPSVLNNNLRPQSDWFYITKNRLIWDAIEELYRNGAPIDLPNVVHELTETGNIQETVGTFYVTGLDQWASIDVHHDAKMLEDLAIKRKEREQAIRTLQGDEIPRLAPTDGFPRTDAGNAEHFAHLYGNKLRYNHQTGTWLLYKKHWWVPDSDGEVIRLAKKATRKRYQAVCDLFDDPKEREKEAKFAIRSENHYRIRATMDLAKAEKPIADDGTGWDQDPWLFGVANGVIDLRDGDLREGKPVDKISKHTSIAFDAFVQAPIWEQFISEIFGEDKDLIEYIYKAIGYSLTGLTREHCLFLCYGRGANGKTTFLNVLRHITGDYGYNTSFTTFELNRYSTSTHDVANLEGKRLVTASETSDSKRLNEARIKALTGGDNMTARHLYRNERVFRPNCKIWLATNHKPILRDDSYGFWRRVHLIPFQQEFVGEKEDKELEIKLKQEAEGILAWAMKGCLTWQIDDGLKPPDIVVQATEDYREESDILADFISDRCIKSGEIAASVLFRAYCEWCNEQSMTQRERLSQAAFGRKMKERFEKVRKSSGNIYLGMSLRKGGM